MSGNPTYRELALSQKSPKGAVNNHGCQSYSTSTIQRENPS